MNVLQKKLFAKNGSVLITTAILIPVLILILGAVIDIGEAMMIKENLYKACLISAEESTKAVDIEKAQFEGVNHLEEDYGSIIKYYFNENIKERDCLEINSLDYNVYESIFNPKYIEISSEAVYKTRFLKLININTINIHAEAIGRLKRID